jgi:hypothetical protein
MVIIMFAFVASLALFGFAANRWGADTRTRNLDPRSSTIFDRP